MSRRPMPSTMPADLAELLSDTDAGDFTAAELTSAKNECIEELLCGKAVPTLRGSVTSRDVFDAAMQDVTEYRECIGSLDNLLGLSMLYGDARTLALHELMSRAAAVITRYVDKDAEMVEERAAAIDGADSESPEAE